MSNYGRHNSGDGPSGAADKTGGQRPFPAASYRTAIF